MSRERELLNKAIEMIQIVPLMASIGHAAPDFGSELILEIQELLAQPEQEQEPVAWQLVANFITDGDILQYTYSKPRDELYEYYRVTPLYTSPPTREGLTPREGLTEYKKGYAQAELDLKRQPLTNENSDTVSAFNPVSNNYWSR